MVTFNGVTFRNPDFGDTDTLMLNRVNKQSRGGDLILSDPFVADGRLLIRYTWTSLGPNQAEKMKALLAQTAGKRVQVIDYNGVAHNVIIMNPDAEVAQISTNSWSVSLDMQVVQNA